MLILLAAACVGGPASAQTWQPYNFPESGFTAQFPAQPTSAKSSYATLKGATVPAMTYAVEQDHVRYAVTVADFSQSDTTSQAAIDDAVKALSATGEVKVDVAARIDREFGRELSIVSKDGARTTAAVFFVKHKLYQLTGTALASAPQSGAARTTRFEETLEFDGEAAGRPENQPGGEGGRGPGGPRRGPPPQAVEACKGRSPGDAVKLTTPRGVVDATCETMPRGLAARPLQPPEGDGPPPPG
jgi:hypothetical protein